MKLKKTEAKITSCRLCGDCCYRNPCKPEPKDISKIAKFLKISIEKCLKKYMIIDYWVNAEGDEYYIAPKRKTDKDGLWEVDRGWALKRIPYIFLTNNNLCQIHQVKPKGGKLLECWNEHGKRYDKEEAKEDWKPYFQGDVFLLDKFIKEFKEKKQKKEI